MIFGITKRTLDTFGGVGSIFAGFVCVWFSTLHNQHESIWKVWVGFAVLLTLNGIAMIIHAQRAQRRIAHQGV